MLLAPNSEKRQFLADETSFSEPEGSAVFGTQGHFLVDMKRLFLYNLAVTVLVSMSCLAFWLAVSPHESNVTVNFF